MKIKNLLKPRILFGAIVFKLQLLLFKKIIAGRNAWRIFDQAGIEGFGTHLIRLFFPIYYDRQKDRDSFSPEVKANLRTVLESAPDIDRFVDSVARLMPELQALPSQETTTGVPYLDNYYFGLHDAAALGTVIRLYQPRRIVEIGSGISTRYMKFFRDLFAPAAVISCIDPFPRADIEGVADVIIRKPLESVTVETDFSLGANDVIFLDGSHYLFQGNDTLTFFFRLLPALPKGVMIHIHDIYLPDDYPGNVSSQLWTEQYLLAALILGGFHGFEVVYPACLMSKTNTNIIRSVEETKQALAGREFRLITSPEGGYSFWFRKI